MGLADAGPLLVARSCPQARHCSPLEDQSRFGTPLGNTIVRENNPKLTLREALASDRLEDFIRQEEVRGVELTSGSDFERALALLITKRQQRSAHGERCEEASAV
jgi:hypothetical protein